MICWVEAINAARQWVRKLHQNPLNHRFIFCPHFSQNLVFIKIFTRYKVLYFWQSFQNKFFFISWKPPVFGEASWRKSALRMTATLFVRKLWLVLHLGSTKTTRVVSCAKPNLAFVPRRHFQTMVQSNRNGARRAWRHLHGKPLQQR